MTEREFWLQVRHEVSTFSFWRDTVMMAVSSGAVLLAVYIICDIVRGM